MSASHGSDKRAAYTGLIVTATLLFIMAFTIVKLTNSAYSKEGGGAAETKK